MKINARNFYKRKLEYIPSYFTKTNLKLLPDPQKDILSRWIYANCNGRFGIVDTSNWEDDQVKSFTTVGFEEPSDLTIFALAGMAQIQH